MQLNMVGVFYLEKVGGGLGKAREQAELFTHLHVGKSPEWDLIFSFYM